MNRVDRRKVQKKKLKIDPNDGSQIFFHTIIKCWEADYRDMTIDFTKADGTSGKLRMQITEIQPEQEGEKEDGKRSSNSQS